MKKLFLLGMLLISLSVSAQQIDRFAFTTMSTCTYNQYTEDWNAWENHTSIYLNATIDYANKLITLYCNDGPYIVKYYDVQQYTTEEAFGNFIFKGYDSAGTYVIVIASALKTYNVTLSIAYPGSMMFAYNGKLIE